MKDTIKNHMNSNQALGDLAIRIANEHVYNEETAKRTMDNMEAFIMAPQTVFTENGMISHLHKNGGSGDVTEDLKDLWGCDESVREAITETAYTPRVYELMRHIKFGRNVTDSDYTELAKLVLDDADNYLFRVSEESNK